MKQAPHIISWTFFIAIFSVNLFGQNKCDSFSKETKGIPPAVFGYNIPANIAVQGSYDVFTTASFIYWSSSQDNMSLGIVSDTSDTLYSLNGNVVQLEESFSPGFKVGVGMNLDRDSWDGYLEYTWYRSSQHVHTGLNTSGSSFLLPAYAVPQVSSPRFFDGFEKWRLYCDFLDMEIARHYYVGTALSFRPFMGVRGAWISQNVNVDYLNNVDVNIPSQNVSISQKSASWAVGPRAGLCSDWMIGKGIRMTGSGSVDLLFTQYTNIKFYEQATTALGVLVPGGLYAVKEKDNNHLRAHLDLELGYGWGTYFKKDRWHIDLFAGYEFQIFFDQNMFHSFIDSQNLGKVILPHGNLYIHGLTSTVRLDF